MSDFKLEKHLVKALRSHLRSLLLTQSKVKRVRLFPQVQVGMIIPDLVVVAHPHHKHDVASISEFESAVFTDLHVNGASICDAVADRLYSQSSRVTKAVNNLCKIGLVRRSTGGQLLANAKLLDSNYSVISVEAKIEDWWQAIHQAISYREFSNVSFIALPASLILRRSDILSICRSLNIGLVSVSKRCVEFLYVPKFMNVNSHKWTWLISKTTGIPISSGLH